MNILLFHSDQNKENRVIFRDPRILDHVNNIIKPSPGDSLKVGQINGPIGTGKVEALAEKELILSVSLHSSPPRETECTIVMAMPRPKVFKRTIQAAVTMGVKSIHVIKTWRVDKNYFESPVLHQENIENQVMLGLEQAGDTMLPEIKVHTYFKPFFEDILPDICEDRQLFIAHPYGAEKIPRSGTGRSVIAFGPEGGFIQYELDRFLEAGFRPISLGERILRVEQAIPAFLSRMFF